jgi:hypothetical protein
MEFRNVRGNPKKDAPIRIPDRIRLRSLVNPRSNVTILQGNFRGIKKFFASRSLSIAAADAFNDLHHSFF